MPVKWTRPKKAADSKPKAEAPKGKAKGKPANAKATADKKEAK